MPTPVGPVPRDPDDPDLWDWYDDADEEDSEGSSHGWGIRAIALVVALAFALLLVFSR